MAKFLTLDGAKIIIEHIKRLENMWKTSLTNCKNCGAPVDCFRVSCEYCGSLYEKMLDNKKE